MADIMGALSDAASANPEKAREVIIDLREKYDSLSPEQQREVMTKLGELKEKVAGLPEEQKQEIEMFIREKAGV
jgi:hypothetical protein